jgi:CheY-like chemotaxis protein
MSGAQATASIRGLIGAKTDCANVPIIALTASTDYGSRELFQKCGASDFMQKPIDAKRLSSVIERYIPKEMQIQSSHTAAPTETADFTIEKIDVQAGVTKTGGSVDTYLRVLKNYYESGEALAAELEKTSASSEVAKYRIKIHAIAGLSDVIGAHELSRLAKTLERAAKENNASHIKHATPSFIADFKKLLKNIEPVIKNTKVKEVEETMSDKKILIIDDTDSYILLLDELLAGDYEILSALDGEDGLETARFAKPDLILLDIVMPGISGIDVLKELKSDDSLKHIPVILMSAQNDDAKEGKALGAAGFCKKPFEPAKIKEAIASII